MCGFAQKAEGRRGTPGWMEMPVPSPLPSPSADAPTLRPLVCRSLRAGLQRHAPLRVALFLAGCAVWSLTPALAGLLGEGPWG